MITYLVSGSNTALVASGALVGAGTSLNIGDGQLGVLSADPAGTIAPDNFITAGTTAANVKAIKVAQGNAQSVDLRKVNAMVPDRRPLEVSNAIWSDKVLSVTCRKPELPRYQLTHIKGVSGLTEGKRYQLNLFLESERGDQAFGLNREQISSTVTLPTGTAQDADYVLQKMGIDINRQSRVVGQSALTAGNKPIMVLGLLSGQDPGTKKVLSEYAAGDTVPVVTLGGTAHTWTADMTFINSLNKAIAADATFGNNEIVSLGATAPGTTAAIDGLLIVVLHEETAYAYDDVKELAVRAQVGFGVPIGETKPNFTQVQATSAFEGAGRGRQLALAFDERARQQLFNLQRHPVDGEYFVQAGNPIDQSSYYITTTIEYMDEELTINSEPRSYKRAIIALKSAVSNPAATAATAYAFATTNATTVTSLNATLGAWLESAAGVQFKGDATTTTQFF